MKEYRFFVAYSYIRNGVFGYGSCIMVRNYENVRIKEFEAEIQEDLKKEGVAERVIVLNVLPEFVKGTRCK